MSAPQGVTILFTAVCLAAPAAQAQDAAAERRAYLDAVAAHFRLPHSEVAILADWEIALDEIPAVLFVARHAGVSPEALVALRRSGVGWSRLIERYDIGPPALHVPVPDDAPTGALDAAYAQFRARPVAQWSSISLTDEEVVALVNVRMIAQALRLSAEEVVRRTDSARSYVALYGQLRR